MAITGEAEDLASLLGHLYVTPEDVAAARTGGYGFSLGVARGVIGLTKQLERLEMAVADLQPEVADAGRHTKADPPFTATKAKDEARGWWPARRGTPTR